MSDESKRTPGKIQQSGATSTAMQEEDRDLYRQIYRSVLESMPPGGDADKLLTDIIIALSAMGMALPSETIEVDAPLYAHLCSYFRDDLAKLPEAMAMLQLKSSHTYEQPSQPRDGASNGLASMLEQEELADVLGELPGRATAGSAVAPSWSAPIAGVPERKTFAASSRHSASRYTSSSSAALTGRMREGKKEKKGRGIKQVDPLRAVITAHISRWLGSGIQWVSDATVVATVGRAGFNHDRIYAALEALVAAGELTRQPSSSSSSSSSSPSPGPSIPAFEYSLSIPPMPYTPMSHTRAPQSGRPFRSSPGRYNLPRSGLPRSAPSRVSSTSPAGLSSLSSSVSTSSAAAIGAGESWQKQLQALEIQWQDAESVAERIQCVTAIGALGTKISVPQDAVAALTRIGLEDDDVSVQTACTVELDKLRCMQGPASRVVALDDQEDDAALELALALSMSAPPTPDASASSASSSSGPRVDNPPRAPSPTVTVWSSLSQPSAQPAQPAATTGADSAATTSADTVSTDTDTTASPSK